MGQAKQRGTFEQRKAEAVARKEKVLAERQARREADRKAAETTSRNAPNRSGRRVPPVMLMSLGAVIASQVLEPELQEALQDGR